MLGKYSPPLHRVVEPDRFAWCLGQAHERPVAFRMEQEIQAGGNTPVHPSVTRQENAFDAWGGKVDSDVVGSNQDGEHEYYDMPEEEALQANEPGRTTTFNRDRKEALPAVVEKKQPPTDSVKTTGTAWQPSRVALGNPGDLVHFTTSPAVPGEDQKKIMIPENRKHIYYFKRRVPGLTADARRLQELETLRLQKCFVETVPPFISQFPRLYQISLNDNKIVQLPDEIGYVKTLKFLSVAGNKLMAVPGTIGLLENLEHLNLARNQITSLPDSLARCTKITDLFVFDNSISNLPVPIKTGKLWPELRLADFSKNSMVHLNPSVGDWKKVHRLDLSANLLVSLPDEFCEMAVIDSLNLADNQLKTLPENFGQLRSLTMIRLERNNLTVLPESVYDLLNVRELNIGGNPLEPLDDIHLWTYGDPIHRFKDTANKLEEITPVPILRSEPGAKQTDGIRFTHILCNNHFSIAGCRYGDHCMFSHIPPPLPTIPFQIDKEKLAESDAKQIQEGTYPGNRSKYYGVKHSKYAKLFEEFGKVREEAGIDHNWRDVHDDGDGGDGDDES